MRDADSKAEIEVFDLAMLYNIAQSVAEVSNSVENFPVVSVQKFPPQYV